MGSRGYRRMVTDGAGGTREYSEYRPVGTRRVGLLIGLGRDCTFALSSAFSASNARIRAACTEEGLPCFVVAKCQAFLRGHTRHSVAAVHRSQP